MFNSTAYFLDFKVFPRVADKNDPRERAIQQLVNSIWVDFDADQSGELDKDETKEFMKTIQQKMGITKQLSDTEFEKAYATFDKN